MLRNEQDPDLDTTTASCFKRNYCSAVNELEEMIEEKANEIEYKNRKLDEITRKLEDKEKLKESFRTFLEYLSKSFIFTPIQNFYVNEIKKFPDIKMASFCISDEVIDIWTFVKSHDMKLRRSIAKIHVKLMKLWDTIDFEFMTVPYDDKEELIALKNNELADMVIFYEKD